MQASSIVKVANLGYESPKIIKKLGSCRVTGSSKEVQNMENTEKVGKGGAVKQNTQHYNVQDNENIVKMASLGYKCPNVALTCIEISVYSASR